MQTDFLKSQTEESQPSTAALMDTIRDCAVNLSDAIKAAKAVGIGVSIQSLNCHEADPQSPLFHIIYSV